MSSTFHREHAILATLNLILFCPDEFNTSYMFVVWETSYDVSTPLELIQPLFLANYQVLRSMTIIEQQTRKKRRKKNDETGHARNTVHATDGTPSATKIPERRQAHRLGATAACHCYNSPPPHPSAAVAAATALRPPPPSPFLDSLYTPASSAPLTHTPPALLPG